VINALYYKNMLPQVDNNKSRIFFIKCHKNIVSFINIEETGLV